MKKPEIRLLKEIRNVVFDKKWLKSASLDTKLYYMYREAAKNKTDKQKIEKAGLRYDITLIPPRMLGKEFTKTLGHEHPLVPGESLTYPELYEVLEGEGIFLLQKTKSGEACFGCPFANFESCAKDIPFEIDDVYIVNARKGDKILISPHYSHITINPSKKELKIANWVADNFEPVYNNFKKYGGACYYRIKANSGIKWVKNKNYGKIPKLRIKKPTDSKILGLRRNEKIYNLADDISKLDFLKRPQDFGELWEKC